LIDLQMQWIDFPNKSSNVFHRQPLLWSVIGVFGLGIALFPIPLTPHRPVERNFRVDASTFEFTPAVLKVNQGDVVNIELNSADVVHGIYLDGYDIQVTAEPGQAAYLKFVADRSGTFRFRCSVSCGALHPFMVGKVKVGSDYLLMRGAGIALLALIAGVFGFQK